MQKNTVFVSKKIVFNRFYRVFNRFLQQKFCLSKK